MLRDTRTAFWLPFAHARHGSIARCRARTCWFVTGQWLHVEPTCVTWFLHCGLHCCFRKLFATYTLHCQTLVNKFTGIWSTSVQCADSQSRAEVKWLCECPGEWIADLVRLNLMLATIIKIYMYHGSCVMYISLCATCSWNWNWKLTQDHWVFNRTLNPAHPPLLCCALLALRSIQLMTGEPRPRYNALQLLGVSGACVLNQHSAQAVWALTPPILSRGIYTYSRILLQ